jgi:hypothetical protein
MQSFAQSALAKNFIEQTIAQIILGIVRTVNRQDFSDRMRTANVAWWSLVGRQK